MNNIDVLKTKFDKFMLDYDMNNEKIKLKYYHTFRVADNAYQLSKSLDMNEEQIEIAYIIGLLYDVGRFYQIKNYDTFADWKLKKFDHGDYGCEMLANGLLKEFVNTDKYNKYILNAVKYHNKFNISNDKNFSELELKYINIIRDADKLDIFNIISNPAQNINFVNFPNSYFTDEVVTEFKNYRLIKYEKMKSDVDKVLVHLGYIYDINYNYTMEEIIKKDYIDKYISILKLNQKTMNDINILKEIVYKYIKEHFKM